LSTIPTAKRQTLAAFLPAMMKKAGLTVRKSPDGLLGLGGPVAGRDALPAYMLNFVRLRDGAYNFVVRQGGYWPDIEDVLAAFDHYQVATSWAKRSDGTHLGAKRPAPWCSLTLLNRSEEGEGAVDDEMLRESLERWLRTAQADPLCCTNTDLVRKLQDLTGSTQKDHSLRQCPYFPPHVFRRAIVARDWMNADLPGDAELMDWVERVLGWAPGHARELSCDFLGWWASKRDRKS
jgi:hypothetical protein